MKRQKTTPGRRKLARPPQSERSLPRIDIRVIPTSEQRVSTLGDWEEHPDGSFRISLSKMSDWRYEFLILVHEIIEWAICQADGVSTADCDAFDLAWETELASGLHRLEDEAGYDRRCPYRRGHVWAERMSRIVAWLLHVKYRAYCEECDADMIRYARDKGYIGR